MANQINPFTGGSVATNVSVQGNSVINPFTGARVEVTNPSNPIVVDPFSGQVVPSAVNGQATVASPDVLAALKDLSSYSSTDSSGKTTYDIAKYIKDNTGTNGALSSQAKTNLEKVFGTTIDTTITSVQTFLQNNVQLNDGTYIAKTDFDKLSTSDQASLVKLGVAGFNAQQSANSQIPQDFLLQNTQIAGGQYVSNSFYNELTPTGQAILKTQGIAAFNNWVAGQTTSVPVTTTTTPPPDPVTQMANVTYSNGTVVQMLTSQVQAMAGDAGGLAGYGIVDWTPIAPTPVTTTQIVTSTTVPSLADVYSDSGWKPNFDSATNGGNPYAGMPSWYQQVESAGFVPSPTNGVNPPSQAYVPLAAGVTYPTNVGQTSFDKMQANPATHIDGATYAGYNPITGQISYNSNAPPANSVRLNDGTYVSNAYYGTLSPTDQLKLFNEGLGTFLGTASIGLSSSVLAQMKLNDPAEYNQYMQDKLTMGNTGAAQAHLALINNAITGGNVQTAVAATSAGAYNFDTWASGLVTPDMKVGNNPAYVTAKTEQALYQDAGGGLAGYQAVTQYQVSNLSVYLQNIYNTTYNNAIRVGLDNVNASQAGLDAVNQVQNGALQSLTNEGFIINGLPAWDIIKQKGIDSSVLIAAGFTPAQIAGGFGQMPTSAIKALPITIVNPATGKTQTVPVTNVPTGIDLVLANQGTYAQATTALTQTIYAQGLVNAEPTQQSIQTLKDKGYDQAIVDAAQKQVNATGGALMAISAGLQLNNLTKAQVDALNDAIHGAGLESNFANFVYDVGRLQKGGLLDSGSYNTVKVAWDKLTPMEQAQVAHLYSQDLYSTNFFAESAKNWAEIAKSEGILGNFTIGAITNITTPIAKKVTGQVVSADEIKTAIMTGLIDASMAMGAGELIDGLSAIAPVLKTISGELMVGAGALNAPSVISAVANPDVSLGQKALAVGGEALLVVGGTLGIKGGITEALNGTPAEIAAAKVASAEAIRVGTVAANPVEEAVAATRSQMGSMSDAEINVANARLNIASVRATITALPANMAVNVSSGLIDIEQAIQNVRLVGESIVVYSKGVPSDISVAYGAISESISNSIANAKLFIDSAKSYAANGLMDDARTAIQNATQVIKDANANAQLFMQSAKVYVSGQLSDTVVNVGDTIQGTVQNARLLVDSAKTYTTGEISDAVNNASQTLQDTLANSKLAVDSINAYAKGIPADLQGAALSAVSELNGAIDNAQLFMDSAKTYIQQGLKDEAIKAINSATQAIKDANANAQLFMQSAKTYVGGTVSDAVDTASTAVKGTIADAQLFAESAKIFTSGEISDAVTSLKQLSADTIANYQLLRDSLGIYAEGIPSDVQAVLDKITKTLEEAEANAKLSLESAKVYIVQGAKQDAVEALNKTVQTLKDANASTRLLVDSIKVYGKGEIADAIKGTSEALKTAIDNAKIFTDSAKVWGKGEVADALQEINGTFSDSVANAQLFLDSLKTYGQGLPADFADTVRKLISNLNDGVNNIKLFLDSAKSYAKGVPADAVDAFKGAVQSFNDRIAYLKLSVETTAHEFELGVQSAEVTKVLRDALDNVKTMDELDALKDSDLYKNTMAKYQDLLDQRIQYYEAQLAKLTPLADKLSALELGVENAVKNALLSDYLDKYEYLKTMQTALNYQKIVDMFSDKPYVNAEGGITQLQRQALLNHISDLDDKEQAKLVQDLLNEHPSDFAKSMQKIMDAKVSVNMDDLTDKQLATYKVWMAQETQQDYINALNSALDPHSSDFAKLMDKLTSTTGKINLDDFTPEQRVVLQNWQKISAMQDYIDALKSAVDPHFGDFAKLMDKLTQGTGTIDFDNLSEADRTALESFTDNLADQRIKEILNPRSSDFAKNMQDLMTAKATGNLDDLTAEQLVTYKAWMAQDATQSYIDALNSALDPHSSGFASLWDKLMTAQSTGDLDALTEEERGVYDAWQSKTLTQEYIDSLKKALDPHSSDFAKTMDSLTSRASVNKQIIDAIDAEIKDPEALKVDLASNPDKIEGLIKRANDTMDEAPSELIKQKVAEFKTALSRAADREHEAAGVEEAVEDIRNDFFTRKSAESSRVSEAEDIVKAPQDYLKNIQERLDRISKLEAEAKAQGIEDLRPIADAEKELLNKDVEGYLKSVQRSDVAETKQIKDELNSYLKNPQKYNLDVESLIERLNKGEKGISMSPEEIDLWQSISADTQRISQLSTNPDAASEIAQLSERIQENMGKLLDLSKIDKPLTDAEVGLRIDNQLKNLGYNEDSIAKLTDSEKLDIVAKGKGGVYSSSSDVQVLKQADALKEQILQDQEILKGLNKQQASGLEVDADAVKLLEDKIEENQVKLTQMEKYLSGGESEGLPEVEAATGNDIPPEAPPESPTDGGGVPAKPEPPDGSSGSGGKAPEPAPEPERGGNVATAKKTEVLEEVEQKTEAEQETVIKTPEELEEMWADKEKEVAPEGKTPAVTTETEVKPEIKPEVETEVNPETITKTSQTKPETTAQPTKETDKSPQAEPVKVQEPEKTAEPKTETSKSPSTQTEVAVPQTENEPYWTYVWENGAIVYRLVIPQQLQQGVVEQTELDAQKAKEQQSENDAAQQLAQRLGISVAKALEMIQNGAQQLAIPSQTQQMNKEQIMEQIKEKEPQPQPQPAQIPAPNAVQTPVKTQEPVKVQEPVMVKEPVVIKEPEPIKEPQPDKIPPPDVKTDNPPITIIPPVVTIPTVTGSTNDKDTVLPQYGALEWRAGKTWVIVPHPYRNEDKYYSGRPLKGTYKFAVGKGSAAKTLQFIGKVPDYDVDVNVGWTNVHIDARKKTITFGGGTAAINKRWDEEHAVQDLEAQERATEPQSEHPLDREDRTNLTVSSKLFKGLTDVPVYDSFIKNPSYARSKGYDVNIVEMSPDEYLEAVAKMQGTDVYRQMNMVEPELVDKYAEMMKNGTKFDLPYIDYALNGQEGRARALAAKQLGVTSMPVLEVTPFTGEIVAGLKKPLYVETKGMLSNPIAKESAARKGYDSIVYVPKDGSEMQVSKLEPPVKDETDIALDAIKKQVAQSVSPTAPETELSEEDTAALDDDLGLDKDELLTDEETNALGNEFGVQSSDNEPSGGKSAKEVMLAKDEPEVIWVKSWEDIPAKKSDNPDENMEGYYDPNTGKIYGVEGVLPKYAILHEKYHAMIGTERPSDPIEYVKDEINATLYAYNQIGRPARLLPELRGIQKDLIQMYKLDAEKAIDVLNTAFGEVKGTPEQWGKDLQRVKDYYWDEYAGTKGAKSAKEVTLAQSDDDHDYEDHETSEEPEVIWVDSWREFPDPDSSSMAQAGDDGKIYAIKGKTTWQVEHEKYHILHNHKDVESITPEQFAREELEATKYAYEKTGQPKHVRQYLNSIYNDMAVNIYKIQPSRAMEILETEFNKVNPPEAWRSDLNKFKTGFDGLSEGLENDYREWQESQISAAKSAKEKILAEREMDARWEAELEKLDPQDKEAYDIPDGEVTQKIKRTKASGKSKKDADEEESDEYWSTYRSQYTNAKPITKAPLELLKQEWRPYSQWKGSPIRIYKVDGDYIRSPHIVNGVLEPAIDADFTQGGHWKVYGYIPKNEVWIERMLNPMEEKYSLIHEMAEVDKMDKENMKYIDAHANVAIPIEAEARIDQSPQAVDEKLEEVLNRTSSEDDDKVLLAYSGKSEPEPMPVKKSKKKKIVEENPENYDSEGTPIYARSYLGARLRPPHYSL